MRPTICSTYASTPPQPSADDHIGLIHSVLRKLISEKTSIDERHKLKRGQSILSSGLEFNLYLLQKSNLEFIECFVINWQQVFNTKKHFFQDFFLYFEKKLNNTSACLCAKRAASRRIVEAPTTLLLPSVIPNVYT